MQHLQTEKKLIATIAINLISSTNRDIKNKGRLVIAEQILVLGQRLKKKDAPRRLYESTTENKPFFNKGQFFVIRKRVQIRILLLSLKKRHQHNNSR